MLNVYIGVNDKAIEFPGAYFDNILDDCFLETELSKRIVKVVDNSELVNRNLVISPVIGSITTKLISGGSKSLIILGHTNNMISTIYLGDNCFGILSEIAKTKDVYIQLEQFITLFDRTGLDSIRVLNDNSIITTDLELARKSLEWGIL